MITVAEIRRWYESQTAKRTGRDWLPYDDVGVLLDRIAELEADLTDFRMVIRHCEQTYDHFTNGRISKANTLPEEVFREAADIASEETREEVMFAIRAFVERVNARAEQTMLATGKLEGAHYAAMQLELAELEVPHAE